MELKLTVNGIDIKVNGEYYAGFSGNRYEPAEPEEFYITTIELQNDHDITADDFAVLDLDDQLDYLNVDYNEFENLVLESYHDWDEECHELYLINKYL